MESDDVVSSLFGPLVACNHLLVVVLLSICTLLNMVATCKSRSLGMAIPLDLATSDKVLMHASTPALCSVASQEHCAALNTAPRSWTKTDCLVCTVVLWSEKGDLKKVVMMSVKVWVTYCSSAVSACFLS